MLDWDKRLAIHDEIEVRLDWRALDRRIARLVKKTKKRFPVGWGWAPHKHRRKRLAKKLQRRGNIRVTAKGPPDKKWLNNRRLFPTVSVTGMWSERPRMPPMQNIPMRPGHTGIRDLIEKT